MVGVGPPIDYRYLCIFRNLESIWFPLLVPYFVNNCPTAKKMEHPSWPENGLPRTMPTHLSPIASKQMEGEIYLESPRPIKHGSMTPKCWGNDLFALRGFAMTHEKWGHSPNNGVMGPMVQGSEGDSNGSPNLRLTSEAPDPAESGEGLAWIALVSKNMPHLAPWKRLTRLWMVAKSISHARNHGMIRFP